MITIDFLRDKKRILFSLDELEKFLCEKIHSTNNNLLRRIEELNLSVRSANCLHYNDELCYVGELVQKTEADLLQIKNFGRKSLNEVKEILHAMGLELGMQIENFPSREEIEGLFKRSFSS